MRQHIDVSFWGFQDAFYRKVIETSYRNGWKIQVRSPASWNHVRTSFSELSGLATFEDFVLDHEEEVNDEARRARA